MKTRVVVTALVAALGLSGAAAGQGVLGRVSARDTGQPIAGALVQVAGPDSTVLRSTLTNEAGRFVFPAAACGLRSGHLYIARLGYRAFRVAILDLPHDCTAWSVTLETDAVPVPALVVEASRNRDLERAGFYGRQRLGLGTFITRKTIDEEYGTQSQLAEVIQRIPGVFRVELGPNEASVYLRPAGNFGGPCASAVYIDGLFHRRQLPRMATLDVEAIEIYRGPAQVPAQYSGAEAACGVVLIWTRTGA